MDVTTEQDEIYLFRQGTNYHAYRLLGAHFAERNGVKGVRFAVWTPHAKSVGVVGDFNEWDVAANPMERLFNREDGSFTEIWTTFVAGLTEDAIYKYVIFTENSDKPLFKSDPYAFATEQSPQGASKLCDLNRYQWQDGEWFERRRRESTYGRPMLIYEVHAGSWRRNAEGGFLTYRELADELVRYALDMHYTHLEFLPLCEHAYDGSWGYQTTGYFAVTGRYGSPDDFRYLVDMAHQHGIGIILDWVPGHFARGEQGLEKFDGAPLYESANPELSENKGWGTVNFDYGRTEVQSFLISNALFWLEEFHIDGLRVDSVANMLYLDFGRSEGEWHPNRNGDNGNLDAMAFLRKLNETVFLYHPEVVMIAEESTAWPMISRPVYMGGMGFSYKWNMGWMNDALNYFGLESIYRRWNHDKLTFSLMYAFTENFILPLSHDEVVHGKGAFISKMPGDEWQKFAGLRGFFGYWMAHPGKKLLFMGAEFAQYNEWNYAQSLDWHLPQNYPLHRQMSEYMKALNNFYLENKPLWEVDFDWNGFQWIDCNDHENSVVTFVRRADDKRDFLVIVCNFTPAVHRGYRIGVPVKGTYAEVFNSDAAEYGGSGVGNGGELIAESISWHRRDQSLELTVPPLACVYLRLKS